jgi:formate C-acetyltransferase
MLTQEAEAPKKNSTVMPRKISLNYTPQDGLSERFKREKELLFSAPAHLDIQKLKIETEVYREWACSKSYNWIKAKIFDRLSREKKIWLDGNPICGHLTNYVYGGYIQPWRDSAWIEGSEEYALQRGSYKTTPEEQEIIAECGKFWLGKTMQDRVRPIIKEKYGFDVQKLVDIGVGLNFDDDMGAMNVPDHRTVIERGFNAVLDDIRRLKKAMKVYNVQAPDPSAGEMPNRKTIKKSVAPMPDYKKWEFLDACETSIKALIHQAHRYAEATREAAAIEKDPVKKAEYEEMAERCDWVPANPARTFKEAIQAQWFLTMGDWQNQCMTVHHAPMRFPQYMYSCYRRDIDEGRITDDEVIEWLQFWFLKVNTQNFVMSPELAIWQQSRIAQQLTIGGLDPETGEDGTNELDFLLLEAQRRAQCPEPLLACMYHNKLSNKFLMKCVELIRTGIGQPSFHGQEVAMKRRLLHEVGPIEDIRDQAVSGCVQSIIAGKTDGTWEARFNMAKPIEFLLSNGVDIKSNVAYGPAYGDPCELKTWEEFYDRLYKYYEFWIDICRDISTLEWNMQRDHPNPLASSVTYDCLERGMDMVDGGCRYNWGDGVCMSGNVDATNSLAAIRKLVYDDKVITMEQLVKAIKADFVGYEDIQNLCRRAPKYGNDNPYVDEIGRRLHKDYAEIHNRKPDYLGRWTITPSAYSVTGHWPFGKKTWATPDGRKAGACFTDATLSANPGTDVKGPTALIRSAVKLIDPVVYGSTHFNVKFHPSALQGDSGAQKFLQLIKTYFDEGGYQIQFNCCTQEQLLEAKKNPEAYKDLIVRVAGFSAYFVTLCPEVQDEIVSRTCQQW